MSAPICNRFHVKQANSGKITIFRGTPFLTPACAGLLKRKRSGLGLLKSTFNAKNIIRRWPWSISSQIAKSSLKPHILGAQCHSRSSMLTLLKSSLPVLVTISSMSVPICNHFYASRANIGKITCF